MTPLETTAYSVPAFYRLATKTLYFIALSCAIGLPINHLLVVRPALRRAGADDRKLMLARSHRLMACTGLLLLVGAWGQLVARVARTTKTPFERNMGMSRITHYLSTPAGKGEWVSAASLTAIQNVLYLVAAVALLALFWRPRTPLVALAGCATILGSLVGALPTKNVDAEAFLDKGMTQLHIIGSCVWVGGLVFYAALSAVRSKLGPAAGEFWASIWQHFGTVALWSVGGVLISGLWLTREGVGSVDQLWGTVYGRVLVLKVSLVCLLMVAGGYNQLVLMPAIERARAAGDERNVFALTLHRFPRVVVTEVVIALGVLVVMPFLAGTARAEAGKPEVGPVDGGTLAIGLLLVCLLALTFWLTAKASAARSVTPPRHAAPSAS